MSNREWARLVRSGESLTVEFKRQVPKLERLSKSFSAFSNSAGGKMFFGVDDAGEVVGLDNPAGTIELVEQVAEFYCEPPIDVDIQEWSFLPGINVVVATIPEAEDKPIYAINPNNRKDAWPFFRSDKENLPLDKKSMKTMRRKPSVPVDDADIAQLDRHAINILNRLNESPRQTLNQLAKSSNISPHRAKKILVQLEQKGWIHSFFNEKRREFSLTIAWKRR